MKKLLSVVLCVALLLSCVFVIPAAAATETGLGRAYKFTFGKSEAKYAYTTSATETYKGNEFTPYGPLAGDIKANSVFDASYKTITDQASGLTHDVLRVQSSGQSWLVPLNAEGKPFELEPGKTYNFNIKAYNTVAPNWSQLFVVGGVSNVPVYSKSLEHVFPSSANGSFGTTFNPIGWPFKDGGYGYAAGNERKYNGFVDDETVDWGGLPSWTPGSNGNVTGELYIPSNTEGKNYASTDSNGSTTFTFSNCDTSGNIISDPETGDIATRDTNNYFALALLGGTYTETLNAGTPEETTVSLPFIMDIESIEIWEDGYTPDIDMYVNGSVTNTIAGEDRGNLAEELYVPPTAKNQVFVGWFADEACTELVSESSVLGATVDKIYAGFAEKKTAIEVDFSKPGYGGASINYATMDDTDAKGSYYANPDRGGWAYQGVKDGALHMYVQTKWMGSGNYVIADENGVPVIAQPNSKYEVTVEYDTHVINAEDVVLPANRKDIDDYNYSQPSVTLWAGAGLPMAQRRSMTDKLCTYPGGDPSKDGGVSYSQSATNLTTTFSFETGDMTDQLPFVCVYARCGAIPKDYNANGDETGSSSSGGAACTAYGFNDIIIKKITVTCLTAGDLTLYVDGKEYDTVDAEDRATYEWPIPNYDKSAMTFNGWFSDAACTKVINTNDPAKVDRFITAAYAGFTPYRDSLVMDPAKDSGNNFINMPYTKADGTYKGNPTRNGYSYQGIEDGVMNFYSQMRWSQYAGVTIVDKYGNPFIVKPDTTYTITVEYNVDQLVKADEVHLREDRFDIDDYTPSDGYVQLGAGIGYSATGYYNYGGVAADNFYATYKPEEEPIQFKETTDGWQTQTFTITTGDLKTHNEDGDVTGDIVPIAVVTVQCAGLPYAYTADGTAYTQAMGGAGDPTWGYNRMLIRKVTIAEEGVTPGDDEDDTVYGDCDGSGSIDTADLVVLKKLLAGLTDRKDCADGVDIDGNGDVDTADLVLLKKCLAGLVNAADLGPQD